MNDYKFKRMCCETVYDIRWTAECTKCGTDFLSEFKLALNEADEKFDKWGRN